MHVCMYVCVCVCVLCVCRTFLVIPELSDEVSIWEANQCKETLYQSQDPLDYLALGLYTRLKNLEFILAEMYTNG